MWKAEGGSCVLCGASRLLGAVSRVLHSASRLLGAVSRVGSGFQAVSRCSAGRVGASGRFSTGYVEVSELTLITKMEGGWNHLKLGSGLGRECNGTMWYDDENVWLRQATLWWSGSARHSHSGWILILHPSLRDPSASTLYHIPFHSIWFYYCYVPIQWSSSIPSPRTLSATTVH